MVLELTKIAYSNICKPKQNFWIAHLCSLFFHSLERLDFTKILKIAKFKDHHKQVLLKTFHLNGDFVWFHSWLTFCFWWSLGLLVKFLLIISLSESIMETCYAVLTFTSVDNILWCDHSNETSSAVLLHGYICFPIFYKIKFVLFLEIWWLALLVFKG